MWEVTFVGQSFTRKPPKYERYIRPTVPRPMHMRSVAGPSFAREWQGLRMTKANVTHPELQATFQLEILGVKKNPGSALYTTLGVPFAAAPDLRIVAERRHVLTGDHQGYHSRGECERFGASDTCWQSCVG